MNKTVISFACRFFFFFLWTWYSHRVNKYPGTQLLDHMKRLYYYIELCKKRPNCSPKWLHYFSFPSAVDECSCWSKSMPAIDTVKFICFLKPFWHLTVVLCFILHIYVYGLIFLCIYWKALLDKWKSGY